MKVKITRAIRIGSKGYGIGQEESLDEDTAKRLVAYGAAVPIGNHPQSARTQLTESAVDATSTEKAVSSRSQSKKK